MMSEEMFDGIRVLSFNKKAMSNSRTIYIVQKSWHGNAWQNIAGYGFLEDAIKKVKECYSISSEPNNEYQIEELIFDTGLSQI